MSEITAAHPEVGEFFVEQGEKKYGYVAETLQSKRHNMRHGGDNGEDKMRYLVRQRYSNHPTSAMQYWLAHLMVFDSSQEAERVFNTSKKNSINSKFRRIVPTNTPERYNIYCRTENPMTSLEEMTNYNSPDIEDGVLFQYSYVYCSAQVGSYVIQIPSSIKNPIPLPPMDERSINTMKPANDQLQAIVNTHIRESIVKMQQELTKPKKPEYVIRNINPHLKPRIKTKIPKSKTSKSGKYGYETIFENMDKNPHESAKKNGIIHTISALYQDTTDTKTIQKFSVHSITFKNSELAKKRWRLHRDVINNNRDTIHTVPVRPVRGGVPMVCSIMNPQNANISDITSETQGIINGEIVAYKQVRCNTRKDNTTYQFAITLKDGIPVNRNTTARSHQMKQLSAIINDFNHSVVQPHVNPQERITTHQSRNQRIVNTTVNHAPTRRWNMLRWRR